MPMKKLARYTLISEIASGGMGTVWRAEDPDLSRQVALKVLPTALAAEPDRLARFRQEARALAAVNHPNIVVIHSVEQDGEVNFLTMELVEGRTLADLAAAGPVGLDVFFNLVLPLTAALAAAHARGIVHRDLKPANVMVAGNGQVKVLDFGLAKLVPDPRPAGESDPERTETLCDEGGLLGTPDFMAPEQVRGLDVDQRTDIHAVGALMFHLLTGRKPFAGRTLGEVTASVLRDPPPPLLTLRPDCPPRLVPVVERCLAKDPDLRYQAVTDLQADLREVHRLTAGRDDQAAHAIAVLPFADMSPQQDQEHFCNGIAEEIINALTRIPRLKVVSRMSSFQYRELGADSREIGRRLGATTLLEGSVRKAADQLRIMAQLIDVGDGCHIWSQRFDRPPSDIFAVQDEIAQSVVKALQLTMAPEQGPALVDVGTRDPGAYDFYLRGRDFFRRWGRRNTQIAQRMFREAIALDPDFATAHAGLADTYSYLYMYINSSAANLEQADRCSARALDLDPALAEAHAARGLAFSLSKRHEAAGKAFRTASELDPNLFEAWYFAARDCVVQGRYQEAVRLYGKAAAASPSDYQIPILTAQIHHALGDTTAEERCNRLGLELAETAILANPEDARACYMGAGAMIRLGQKERGLKWARRALALDPDDPAILYNVACSYAGLGLLDEAIDCLAGTVRVGAAYREWMLNDSDLDPLRENPRFQALLASLD